MSAHRPLIMPRPWPKDWSGRLLVEVDGRLKRLFNVAVRLSADCSLQLTFDYAGRDSMSYHPTGLVTFKSGGQKLTVVLEPLFAVTAPNHILLVSIPDVAVLNDYDKTPCSTDRVVPWPRNEWLTLVASVMPPAATQVHASALFEHLPTPLFDLCFLHGEHPSVPIGGPKVTVLRQDRSLGPLKISEQEAYVRMRHVMHGSSDGWLLVGPNGAGEYELTFPGSFARRPVGLINPADPDHRIDVVWYERHHLRFRVTDRSRRVIRESVMFVGGDEDDSAQWWPVPNERYLGLRNARKAAKNGLTIPS